MAINHPRLWLVCYDITDPKRLARVHRYLREIGLPLQYSVFTLALTRKQQLALRQELKRRIDEREDDVRIYPMPENGERLELGKSLCPEGITFIEAGARFFPTTTA